MRLDYPNHALPSNCKSEALSNEYKNFTMHFIAHLLKNELLTGRKMKTDGCFERADPPIISVAQFERCRDIAAKRNTSYGKVSNVYYAKSLIVCPECGSKMSAYTGSRYAYRCNNAYQPADGTYSKVVNNWKDCSSKTVISINALDSLLWYLAVEQESQYLWGSAMEDISQFEAKIATIQAKIDAIQPRLKDLESKRSRIVMAFLDGDINKEFKTKKTVELDAQKLEIMKQQIAYEKDIDYFKERIEDIRRLYAVSGDDATAVADGVETIMDVKEKIEKTENDEEKSRLVHKHIKQIQIVKRMIPYQRKAKWIKSTEVEAKYVTVSFVTSICYAIMVAAANGFSLTSRAASLRTSIFPSSSVLSIRRNERHERHRMKKTMSSKECTIPRICKSEVLMQWQSSSVCRVQSVFEEDTPKDSSRMR